MLLIPNRPYFLGFMPCKQPALAAAADAFDVFPDQQKVSVARGAVHRILRVHDAGLAVPAWFGHIEADVLTKVQGLTPFVSQGKITFAAASPRRCSRLVSMMQSGG